MSLLPTNGGLLGGGGLLGENPLLNIGLGILANNTGNYGRAGPAIGRGFQQGIQQSQIALQQAAAQKMMKAQMEEMEEDRKRRRGTTEALSKAYNPAGNVANMSFMDANNEAMAGGNPDFQINQSPASFDISRALPEIMQVNPELGMQLYQQEQERQRQAQFQQQMQGVIGNGGADWQNQAQLGVLGSINGMKGASSLIELAKLNKPDPSVDLAAAKYFDETGQWPPNYTPPQMRGQQSQAGNLPTNNFGMPVTWSGADFGAPGTTQEDVNGGIRSEADINVLDPRKARPISGPLITPMPPGLSPQQQREYRKKEAETNLLNPLQRAELAERTGTPTGKPLTPAQRKVDEAFGTEYQTYVASGGFSDTVKQIQQLKDAAMELEKGGISGPMIGMTPDSVLAVTNPRAMQTRESIEEVVQRNLRIVLGAQFTEKEGERLISRSFNPKLPDAENATRLNRLIKQMETAAAAKNEAVRYYEENGTLQGWKGKLPTISDFDPDNDTSLIMDKNEPMPTKTYDTLPKKAPKGQVVRNPETGERMRFDGLIWRLVP